MPAVKVETVQTQYFIKSTAVPNRLDCCTILTGEDGWFEGSKSTTLIANSKWKKNTAHWLANYLVKLTWKRYNRCPFPYLLNWIRNYSSSSAFIDRVPLIVSMCQTLQNSVGAPVCWLMRRSAWMCYKGQVLYTLRYVFSMLKHSDQNECNSIPQSIVVVPLLMTTILFFKGGVVFGHMIITNTWWKAGACRL